MRAFSLRSLPLLAALVPGVAAAINRALQFVVTGGVGSRADLTVAGTGTALSGTSWSRKMRLRIDAAVAGGSYLTARANGASDEHALIHNYAADGANVIAFFSNGPAGNSTGGTIRLALTIATPPGPAFVLIEFTYDGATLRGFVDGAAAGSLATVMTLNAAPDLTLSLGARNNTGGAPSNLTIDYDILTVGTGQPVNLQLNEAAGGPYANTGTAGGTLTLTTPPPTSVTL